MKFPAFLVSPLLGGLALLSPAPTVRAAPFTSSAPNPPGTRELYSGSACEYDAAPTADGAAPAARSGSVQLEVMDGNVTGRFWFPATGGEMTTTTCRGYLDPAANRGFLKLDTPADGQPMEKVALLLRQGALTGGTMDADGRVLAFRLERFLVVLP